MGTAAYLVLAGDSDDEPVLDSRVQSRTFDTAPADLKAAILSTAEVKSPACAKKGQIVDRYGQPDNAPVLYAVDGSNAYARTVINCDGATNVLLAKTGNDTWRWVGVSRYDYKCVELTDNRIPLWFMQSVAINDGVEDDDDPQSPTVTCVPSDPNATISVPYLGQ